MTYDQVLATIAQSSKDDWTHDNRERHWTFKSDLMIRFANTTDDEYGEDLQDRTFDEAWTATLPDKKARRAVFTIYYGASFIKEVELIIVDGGRATMPMPEAADAKVVDPGDYDLARIINPASLDKYMQRFGFTVRDK